MMTMDGLIAWLAHYKGFALFGLLALGIVGLPIPDETLMTFAGALIAKGYLDIPSTLIAAYAGSFVGITISYWIGRTAGTYLIKQYGYRIGLTQEKVDQVHAWFEKIGKWTLLVGYFIPGVRHLTGYVAGATELHFTQFAIFAYTGATIWVTLFLTLGYFSSKHWKNIFAFAINNIGNLILLLGIVAICGLAIRMFYKKRES